MLITFIPAIINVFEFIVIQNFNFDDYVPTSIASIVAAEAL